MFNQPYPNYPYFNLPQMQIPKIQIIEGGTIPDEDSIPQIINKEKIIENTLAFLKKKDECGSKIIQDLYENSPIDIRNKIFDKIKDEINNIAIEEFGNYFLAKIIEINNPNKIDIIYNSIIEDIENISFDSHGTYVVQKLLEKIDENRIDEIAKKICLDVNIANFEELAKKNDEESIQKLKNINHIIQKIIKKRQMKKNDEIGKQILASFDLFVKNQYGCYILQALLSNCKDEYYDEIYKKTYENFNNLIHHIYGNYLIEFFFKNDKGKNNDKIYEKLTGHILEFTLHEYAYKSIMKAIKKGTPVQRKNIIDEIVDKNDKDRWINLTKHPYGNFVLQKILKYGDEETRLYIIKIIYSEPNFEDEIKKHKCGKHVVKKIEKINIKKNGAYNSIIYNINDNK